MICWVFPNFDFFFRFEFVSCVTYSVFEFCHLSIFFYFFLIFVTLGAFEFCPILCFWVASHFQVLGFVIFWVLSFVTLWFLVSFVTFWVFEFCHFFLVFEICPISIFWVCYILSFWVRSKFEFLSFVIYWLLISVFWVFELSYFKF